MPMSLKRRGNAKERRKGEKHQSLCSGVEINWRAGAPSSQMKRNQSVSSSRRKAHKAYYTAPSHIRRRMMSSRLSKDLQKKYGVKTMPIRINDEVVVMSGHHKETAGKVISVCRKNYTISIDKLVRTKGNKQTVQIPIHPSNVQITKLYINNDRSKILERRKSEKRMNKE